MAANRLVTCPNCSATFSVPEGVSSVKCPYCGYQLVFTSETILGFPVYSLPVKIPKGEAVELYVEEMAKQAGVDENSLNNASKSKITMFLVPFVIFDVNSRGIIRYRHWHGDVSFSGEVASPLNEKFEFLAGISVPPAAREPIDVNLLESSVVIPAEFNVKALRPGIKKVEEEVKVFGISVGRRVKIIRDTGRGYDPRKPVERFIRDKLNEYASARGQRVRDVEINMEPVSVVYMPFYLFEYGPQDRFVGIMNASNGEVIAGEYTQNESFRRLALGAGMGAILTGILTWVVTGSFYPLLAGIVSAAIPLYRSAVRVQSFGTKGGVFSVAQIEALRRWIKSYK